MANEKRLIDANSLLAGICKDCGNGCDLENNYCLLATEIMKAPTVDAVEVVHGRWILEQEYEDGTADYKCSACDYDDAFHRNLVNAFYNYCPNCGAKMDGGNEDG